MGHGESQGDPGDGYLDGTLDEAVPESPRLKKFWMPAMELQSLSTECPSGSDIPWVAISGRALAVQRKGEAFSQKILTNTRFLCEAGSALAPLVNLSCDIAPLRWGLEAVTGLDREIPAKIPQEDSAEVD